MNEEIQCNTISHENRCLFEATVALSFNFIVCVTACQGLR